RPRPRCASRPIGTPEADRAGSGVAFDGRLILAVVVLTARRQSVGVRASAQEDGAHDEPAPDEHQREHEEEDGERAHDAPPFEVGPSGRLAAPAVTPAPGPGGYGGHAANRSGSKRHRVAVSTSAPTT